MRIQSLWIGESLTTMETLCIQSFLANGHEFILYVYDEVLNVPYGTDIQDAAAILPVDMIRRFKYLDNSSVSPFSNVFRFKLLLEQGGIWSDMDVVCLRPFEIVEEYCFPLTSGAAIHDPSPEFSIDSWFIKVPQGCELMRFCYETALLHAGREMLWGTIGPGLLTNALLHFDLHRFAREDIFFPVNWNRQSLLIDGSEAANALWQSFGSRSHVMHLYHEMWRQNRIDKTGQFPPGSIYAQVRRRYLGS